MQLQGWGCEGAVTHPTVFSDSNLVFPQFQINMTSVNHMTSSQEEPHFSLFYSIQFTLIIRCFADHMIEGLQFWIISTLRYFLYFPSNWQIAEGTVLLLAWITQEMELENVRQHHHSKNMFDDKR